MPFDLIPATHSAQRFIVALLIACGFRLHAIHSIQRLIVALLIACGLAVQPVYAQIVADKPSASSVRYGQPVVVKYRVGAEVTASRGAYRNVLMMVAVPLECPEQQVRLVEEDISSGVEVSYRMLQNDGAKQMLMLVPSLAKGTTAKAILTYEVEMHPILPPEETKDLKIPERVPRDVRRYTSGSPYIEVNHRKIRSLAKEIFSGVDKSATDWERVEAIYDYVLEHIAYVEGEDKSALDTLRDGQADCYGRSALFVALCRANDIPARMVWVDGHAYPEFYLEDAAGEGHWYPCESAGTRAFGDMPLARIILQKGDNFQVPERPRERLRYASDYGIATGGKPAHRFIHQPIIGQ
jgi:transglutaminase-like putative cysteine protease